jgi:AraC-like DNA-binding protein
LEIHLSLAGDGPIRFQPGLPDHYHGRILTGATAMAATGLNGSLVIQEYKGSNYSLRYSISRFLYRTGIMGFSNSPGLYIRVLLEGDQQYRIGKLGKIRLRKGQYIILHAEEGECLSHYEAEKTYQCLDLYFNSALVAPLAGRYPGLTAMLNRNPAPIIRLNRPHSELNFFIWQVVEQLFKSPFDPSTNKLYLDDRAGELLVALLENGYRPPVKYRYTEQETQALLRTKEFIETNFTKHFTIQELAQRTGMNEFDLKAGFRQFFGKGVFEVLLSCRMKVALDLVLHSDQSMKQISYEVGYKRLTSFINAFRKFYGHSPGKMRSNR